MKKLLGFQIVAFLIYFSSLSFAIPCPIGCNVHGTCNEEIGRCDCPRHLSGQNCSTRLQKAEVCKRYGFALKTCTSPRISGCLNECNSRGNCVGGWCHCNPGFWGMDCSLSMGADGKPELLANLGYKLAKEGPYIYVYDVPPRYNSWRNVEKMDRPLYSHILNRFLTSGHRVADPDKADYFYIPTDFRFLYSDAISVLRYVWKTWPHWNATAGAKHLLLSSSDLGGCEGASLMRVRNITSRSTWLTPWGLTRKHPRVWWPGCHRPGLDIVIPVLATCNAMLSTPLNPRATRPVRNMTFFFSGKICGDNLPPRPDAQNWPVCQTRTNPLYSAGMRQQVYHHHALRPGYKIVPHSPTYAQDMATSTFCLAPTGGGHGKRQVLVMRFGCIPVPITDYVMQPFEPELNWSSFSVPVLEADVPRMHTILEAIPETQVKAMQRSVVCAAHHMWWSSMYGGLFGEDGRYDAFATMMEILRARLHHPGAPADKLISLDERFRKFANCELGPDDQKGASKQLCTYSRDSLVDYLAPTTACPSPKTKYGIPGSAVCEGASNLAQCHRPWQ